jgi:hypothetical protein
MTVHLDRGGTSRWTAYRHQFDAGSLVLPHRAMKRERYWPQEILDICNEAIETIYLTRERGTKQKTLGFAVWRIMEINLIRHARGLDSLRLPSRRLIERLLREIPAFDIYCARYGRQAATWKFRSVKGHTITSGPFEWAEIDDVGAGLTRALGHKGIAFEGLFYNSEALSELRKRCGAQLVVRIRVNDGNIGSIHVLYEGSVIQVPALRHSYADGLSLSQHQSLQHQAGKSNPAGWLEAKERMRQMCEEGVKPLRRITRGLGGPLEGGGGKPALPIG